MAKTTSASQLCSTAVPLVSHDLVLNEPIGPIEVFVAQQNHGVGIGIGRIGGHAEHLIHLGPPIGTVLVVIVVEGTTLDEGADGRADGIRGRHEGCSHGLVRHGGEDGGRRLGSLLETIKVRQDGGTVVRASVLNIMMTIEMAIHSNA